LKKKWKEVHQDIQTRIFFDSILEISTSVPLAKMLIFLSGSVGAGGISKRRPGRFWKWRRRLKLFNIKKLRRALMEPVA